WVYKEAEGGNCCWDVGYRADAVYGTDTRFIGGLGLDLTPNGVPQWNRDSRFYGIVTPQFYVEAKKCDWTIRAGRFISPVGYATVQTYQNFFTILPYTFQYGEPFTHTGVTVTNQLNDQLSVMGGVVRGWDNIWDNQNRVNGMGLVTLTGDCEDTLAFFTIFGNEFNGGFATTDFRYLQSLVYTRPINDNVTVVLQSDFGTQANAQGPGTATGYWYGVNAFAYYKFDDCLSWGVNAEWFRDDGGNRVGGFLIDRNGAGATGDRGLSGARSGYNGSFYRFMTGPKWTPNKNVIFRSAVALDVYDGPVGRNGNLPYNNGTGRNQFVWTNDVIFMY
ncbi:MAG: outer membrane beta-barrel protein, partial [Pirellulales bacterium]